MGIYYVTRGLLVPNDVDIFYAGLGDFRREGMGFSSDKHRASHCEYVTAFLGIKAIHENIVGEFFCGGVVWSASVAR